MTSLDLTPNEYANRAVNSGECAPYKIQARFMRLAAKIVILKV